MIKSPVAIYSEKEKKMEDHDLKIQFTEGILLVSCLTP